MNDNAPLSVASLRNAPLAVTSQCATVDVDPTVMDHDGS
jgi:hypothetical protein